MRDRRVAAVLRDVDVRGERRSPEGAQVDLGDDVISHAVVARDAPRRLDLRRVPLSVAKGHRMHVVSRVDGVRQHRRGIEPAREEEDGFGHASKIVP